MLNCEFCCHSGFLRVFALFFHRPDFGDSVLPGGAYVYVMWIEVKTIFFEVLLSYEVVWPIIKSFLNRLGGKFVLIGAEMK